MKGLIRIFCSAAILLIFAACQNDEERIFSCDSVTNEWVHQNLSEIHEMDRMDWTNSNQELAIPIYRAFTAEQKVAFWMSKLKETMSLDWSEREKAHIERVIQFIEAHKYLFEKDVLEEELEKVDLFFYTWIYEAEHELGWSDYLCYAIVGTGYSLKNTQGELQMPRTKKAVFLSSTEPDCNCSKESDWCFGQQYACKAGSCDEASDGCGTLFVHACDGRCWFD